MNNNLHEIKEEIYKYYKLIEKIQIQEINEQIYEYYKLIEKLQIQEINNYNNYYVEYYS